MAVADRSAPAPAPKPGARKPPAPAKHAERIECPDYLVQVVSDRLDTAIQQAGRAAMKIMEVRSAADEASAAALWEAHGFVEWFGPYSKGAARRVERSILITAGKISDPSTKVVCRTGSSPRCKSRRLVNEDGKHAEVFGAADPFTKEVSLCGLWFNDGIDVFSDFSNEDFEPSPGFANNKIKTSDGNQVDTILHEGAHAGPGAPDSTVKGAGFSEPIGARWLARQRPRKAQRNAENIAAFMVSGHMLPDGTLAIPVPTVPAPPAGEPDYFGCEQKGWHDLNMDSKSLQDTRRQLLEKVWKLHMELERVNSMDLGEQVNYWTDRGVRGLVGERPAVLRRILRRGARTLQDALIKCSGGMSPPAELDHANRWLKLRKTLPQDDNGRMQAIAEAGFAAHTRDHLRAHYLAKLVVAPQREWRDG